MKKKFTVISSGSDVAATPSALGVHGAALWARVMNEFDIADVGGRELLYQACAACDRAENCREAIERDGAVLRVKNGPPRAHPLIREELNARAFVCRQLVRLGVTFEPVKPLGRPPQPVGWKGESA